jgi:hypothetical protein
MPLLTNQVQKELKQQIIKQFPKDISWEKKRKIKDGVDQYKITEGSVEDLRGFKAVLGDVYRDKASQVAYVESMQCALLVTTDALINNVERACREDGVTIDPEPFRMLVIVCAGSGPTQAAIELLQRQLDAQLETGVKYYNENEKSTTSMLESCFYRVKNLIGLIVGLVTCVALCYAPYREGLQAMFFTPPETNQSRAFRSHAARLNHDVVAHVEACVNTGP